MTSNATYLRLVTRVFAFNSIYDLLMTLPASLFSYLPASGSDVDVVFVPTGGEVVGMPEPIPTLCSVFANESRRRVTIVTNSDSSMT
jgi:hypothetical protein